MNIKKEMEVFSYHKALQHVFEMTSLLNKYIDSEAPWKLAKENDPRLKTVLYNLWNGLRITALLLYPFMPVKSQSVWSAVGIGKMIEKSSFDTEKVFYFIDDMAAVGKIAPIFPRIED
jgi:methionyl-tRNA synthetase